MIAHKREHTRGQPSQGLRGGARPGWYWPASSSSQRPLSSSPRSSLVLVSSPHTAPSSISVMEILKTVKPATVWSCGAGPNRALVAWFEPKAAASASRWAGVL